MSTGVLRMFYFLVPQDAASVRSSAFPQVRKWGGWGLEPTTRIMRSLPSPNDVSSCTNSTGLVIHGTHRTSIHPHPGPRTGPRRRPHHGHPGYGT